MKPMMLVFRRDVRDLVRQTAFRILCVALCVFELALAVAAWALAGVPEEVVRMASGLPSAAVSAALLVFLATMFPYLVVLWVFAGTVLAGEKASGRLETVLATPLSVRSLWLGKTAALVVPGLVIGLFSLAAILAAAALAPSGAAPGFFVTLPAFISCLLGNFMLFSGLGAITILVALRFGTDASVIPSFAIGFGLMMAIPAGSAFGIIDPSGWFFTLACCAMGLAEWLVVWLAGRSLSKEKIVLSGRVE